MDRKLDEQLCTECPNLYADRDADMMATCMCWGFECMAGWFPIIRDLSLKLEAIIAAMPEEERTQYRAMQVKEKFGTLRFYMTTETDEMQALIDEAEEASAVTCECCGQPGKLRTQGWLFTLCDKCDEERPWRG